MAKYSVNNNMAGTKQAMAAAYKTLVNVSAATATLSRALIYDILVGTNGTPADTAMEFNAERSTTVGTGTTATLLPLDNTIRASASVGTVNQTVEPAITANTQSLFYIGMNQRASYRWVAAPGSELVIPATNLAGIALRALSIAAAYTGTATGHVLVDE